jgi:hypothetical protein
VVRRGELRAFSTSPSKTDLPALSQVVPVDPTAPSQTTSPSETFYDFSASKNQEVPIIGNQEEYNKKLQAKMDAMAKHRERRAGQVMNEFPDFMLPGLQNYSAF